VFDFLLSDDLILFDIKPFHGFGRSAFGLWIDLMWEPCGKKSTFRASSRLHARETEGVDCT
jgi:hypothetical protein